MKDRKFNEADWRLFREKIPQWQENYIDRLNREYMHLLGEERAPSEKFWSLQERLKKDINSVGVRLEMRRSDMLDNIVQLVGEGVIDMEDLHDFSDTLKDTVRFIRERQIHNEYLHGIRSVGRSNSFVW